MRVKLTWALIWIIVAVPALLWLRLEPLVWRFGDLSSVLLSLGKLAGLMGMSLFSLNLILSARFKFWDRGFGGLNKVYVNHHLVGGIAFILLMAHPLFLAGSYLVFSLPAAAAFLLPDLNWPVNFGKAALAAMMLLLVLTFFVSLRYHVWKYTHKFLGAAFFLGGLHLFLIPSDVARDLVLRFYMLTLAGLGVLAYIYNTIFHRFGLNRFLYLVEDVKPAGQNVVDLALAPLGKKMEYLPGQFVFVSFGDERVGAEWHPFSITSAPAAERLSLEIKTTIGDFVPKLATLQKGSTAKLEGPFGGFTYYNFKNKNQIWIAGGIGITPFLSMGRHLEKNPDGRHVHLFYSVKNKDEATDLPELQRVGAAELQTIPFFTDERGFLDGKTVANIAGGLANKEILICGPLAMMRSLRKQLLRLGAKKDNIHSEEFQLS